MKLTKPKTCESCPMFQEGEGFVPDENIEGAKVFILGQNPEVDEEEQGRPFIGKTGREMEVRFFPLAQLVRGKNVSLGHVIRCRWKNSDDLPPSAIKNVAANLCQSLYFHPPASTELIVAQGGLAWKAMGEGTSIREWRGYLAP